MMKTEQADNTLLFSRRPLISNRPPKLSSSKVYTYYGGVSAGVPFLWESKPGTPIHSFVHHNATSYPPLNPPPCYNNRNTPVTKRRSKSLSFRSVFKFPVFISGKKSRYSDLVPAPESLSPSSSSSASSVPSSPVFRPLAIFRRSQSTSIGHRKTGFVYDFDDDNSIMSRGSTARCFWY